MTTHLPLAKTTSTRFCSAFVPLDLFYENGQPIGFFLDGNSKITAGNGTYADPKPNALSLPAASVEFQHSGNAFERAHVLGRSCPGSTSVCRSSCYVKGLAKHAPVVYSEYLENLRALEVVLANGCQTALANAAAEILARWIGENAPGGFRWHVSGDVLSIDHAVWIADVCERVPQVQFWIYTRTLEAVGYLMTPNLAVNVSADRDNYDAARATADLYGARLCYLSDDGQVPRLPPGSVIFPDYALRGRDLAEPTSSHWWQSLTQDERKMVCPTDFFGQSEEHRCGPCRKCF